MRMGVQVVRKWPVESLSAPRAARIQLTVARVAEWQTQRSQKPPTSVV